MKGIVAFVSGFLFALGLGLSGMTQPQVVRGFLDVFGDWDWRLLGVMAGAIGVHATTYHFIIKRSAPVLDSKFQLPTKSRIDKRLVMGSLLFGIGWGWAGICPGPGIVGLVSGNAVFFYFIGSMGLGMKAYQLMERT